MTLVEIQRKFSPTRLLLKTLTRSAPSLPPLFALIHPGPEHFIRDVYYDRLDRLDGPLVSNGVRVRRRTFLPDKNFTTSSWELRVRLTTGEFLNFQGAEKVERAMQLALGPRAPIDMDNIETDFGIIADLTTRRREWNLEIGPSPEDYEPGATTRLEHLTVVIDQVVKSNGKGFAAVRADLDQPPPRSFFYENGELGLVKEVRTEGLGEFEHELDCALVASSLTRQLKGVMRAQPQLFPIGPEPRGKLAAYLAWVDAGRDGAGAEAGTGHEKTKKNKNKKNKARVPD
ncbi:hypothetical protein B0H11DRAFT_2274913 [Mycena galericulata]|nr:hypothetical protein B0H11DRAFT_2274913 [Mycena galericulata]